MAVEVFLVWTHSLIITYQNHASLPHNYSEPIPDEIICFRLYKIPIYLDFSVNKYGTLFFL